MSRIEERLRLEPDGRVLAFSGKVEMGQGIRTAFAMLVAEELRVPLASVEVVLGDTDRVPWDIGTFGSLSVRQDGALLQRAAAFARQLLAGRAAERLGVEPAALVAAAGGLRAPDGRTLLYTELLDERLTGEIPDDVVLIPQAERRLVGRPVSDGAARALVAGKARLVADLRPPGMLHGRVLHPPRHGAALRALDETAARAVPGVVAVVRDGDFAGVLAGRPEQARAALEALAAEWDPPPSLQGEVERHLTLRGANGEVGRPDSIPAPAGGLVFEARYRTPFVASAPIGTSAALADVRDGGASVHAATQRPFGLRQDVARLLGLPDERVRVVAEPAAGSYGRNNFADAALEAVRLSRAVGAPVLVEWSRADEFRAAPNRPALEARVRAVLDTRGHLLAWTSDVVTHPHVYGGDLAALPDHVIAMACGRNAVPPYRVPATVELHVLPSPVRTAALRSLSGAPNTFAVESAIDELAAAAGAEPLEFRLRHLEDARLRRTLDAVADRSGWTRPAGRMLGLACAIYRDTRIAQVVEVHVAQSGGVRLAKVWCAVDCGTIVNPDGGRNQIEGAIVQAASWALLEELRHRDGRIAAASWDDYPIARFADAPAAVDLVWTDDGRQPPTGLGEAGVVPLAAAIANAVAAGTGARVRELPLSPERLRAAHPSAR